MTDIPPENLTSYDQLPYDSHPYERTHPDHLATMARLFGLESPLPETARVLEIGCAAGGNLIPLAVALPEAEFVGFDLSRTELAEGQQRIDQLGLTNIRLEQADILTYDPAGQTFDYIICHGVFSWVAAAARERILAICRQTLAPTGVAYISYNTYPGWFLRGMVRQMLCFHARQFSDPSTQVEQARALLNFLSQASSGHDPMYHALLRRELDILKDRQNSYLYHEHLEQDNEPLFFYQFAEAAAAHDLRFLCETQFSEMVPGQFSPEVSQTWQALSQDLIHSEQYLDFLRNRTFRRTLLCRSECALQRELGPTQLREMWLRGSFRPDPGAPSLDRANEQRFTTPAGAAVTVAHPVLKGALSRLAEAYPAYVRFQDLPHLVHAAAGPILREREKLEQDYAELAALVFRLLGQNLIDLRVRPVRYATRLPAEPRTTPLIKLQAAAGDMVTSLKHELVPLNDMDRHMLACLEMTPPDRLAYFRQQIDSGRIVISTTPALPQPGDASPTTDAQLEQLIRHGLQRLLDRALILPT